MMSPDGSLITTSRGSTSRAPSRSAVCRSDTGPAAQPAAAPAEDSPLYCNTKSECIEAFPVLMNWIGNNQKELFVPSSTSKIEGTIERYGSDKVKKQKENLRKGMANLPKALADILDIFGQNPVDASAFETYAASVDVSALETLVVATVSGSSDPVRKHNATFVLDMGKAIDLADAPTLRNLKVALYNWALLLTPMSDLPVVDDLSTLIGKDACILKKGGEEICGVVEAVDENGVTVNGETFLFGGEDALLFGELPEGFDDYTPGPPGSADSADDDNIGLTFSLRDVNAFAVFPRGADPAFVLKDGFGFGYRFPGTIFSFEGGIGWIWVASGGIQDGYNRHNKAAQRITGFVSGSLTVDPVISKKRDDGKVRDIRWRFEGEGSAFFNGGGSAMAHTGLDIHFGKEERKVRGKCGFGASGGWFTFGQGVSHLVDATDHRDSSGDRDLAGPAVGGYFSCGLTR